MDLVLSLDRFTHFRTICLSFGFSYSAVIILQSVTSVLSIISSRFYQRKNEIWCHYYSIWYMTLVIIQNYTRVHVSDDRYLPPNIIWRICRMELFTIQLDSSLKTSAASNHTGTNISENPAIRLSNWFLVHVKLADVRLSHVLCIITHYRFIRILRKII